MTSADQHQPASTPPEASPSAPARPPAALERVFATIASVGTLVLLICGGLVLLTGWIVGWDLIRPWLQVAAIFAGVFLVVGAAILRATARARRLVIFAGGLMLLLAVADSLDGKQDVLPLVTVLLTVWALIYANTTAQLLESGRPATPRRWLAVSFGILAVAGYLGTAGYYFILNLTSTPINIDQHPLYAFGIVISFCLGWLGEMPPYGGPLTGAVRVCASCGLRNIPERHLCKRCRARLGPVKQIT